MPTIPTPEELLLDESFQNWARQSNPDDVAYWQNWIQDHPEGHWVVQEAAQMIRMLDAGQKIPVAEEKVDEAIRKVTERMGTTPATSSAPKRKSRTLGMPAGWQQMAAVLIGLLVVSLGAYWWLDKANGSISYRTQAKETRTVLLPDGSRVTLNAHSSLRFANDWEATATREVWLEGEGYFEVKHFGKPTRKFVVHASQVAVEVLGTTFNVWQRQDQMKVVLQTGKVQLKHPASPRTVLMKPDQMAELSVNRPHVTVRPVDARIYTSWKNHQLEFDGTPMSEVASLIELRYGYRVAFTDSAATREKLTYKPNSDDFALFLRVLQESFRVQLNEDQKTLTISSY